MFYKNWVGEHLLCLCFFHVLATPIGYPILRFDACSESETSFTCTVNQTTLEWEIDFSGGPEISSIRVRYFSSDMIGSRSQMVIVTNRATSYIFYLTSKSPLSSTMKANTSRDLNGAMVTCRDGFTDAALKDTLIVHGD